MKDTTTKKWKNYMEDTKDDEATLSIDEISITITSGKKKRNSIKELFEGYDGRYECVEWNILPEGKEII